jgi:hypothetical protein
MIAIIRSSPDVLGVGTFLSLTGEVPENSAALRLVAPTSTATTFKSFTSCTVLALPISVSLRHAFKSPQLRALGI